MYLLACVCVCEPIHKSKVLVSETFRLYYRQNRPKTKWNASIIKCYLYNINLVIEKDSRDFFMAFHHPLHNKERQTLITPPSHQCFLQLNSLVAFEYYKQLD